MDGYGWCLFHPKCQLFSHRVPKHAQSFTTELAFLAGAFAPTNSHAAVRGPFEALGFQGAGRPLRRRWSTLTKELNRFSFCQEKIVLTSSPQNPKPLPQKVDLAHSFPRRIQQESQGSDPQHSADIIETRKPPEGFVYCSYMHSSVFCRQRM